MADKTPLSDDGDSTHTFTNTPNTSPPPNNPPKLDHTSPFYLSSNDNPGTIISTVTFTGHNYDEWSKSLRLSLIARRKFGFIDGSVVKPITRSLVADWQCVQAMLVQWIRNTIDMSLRKTIPYFEEARPL
ncbi:hypothetical protein LIER_34083 [Lithospermum erythrorhizon]|uniref:Retrotransposon Copia-like N-terminal domain-containing protein n=1 Tax=Lithospermum erythrorhizon TaxID=34254 RepID=A0AAV3S1L5_LITER